MTVISQYDAPRLRPIKSTQRPGGELEAVALPAVTGAAAVSLRALLRAPEMHEAHHTASTFVDDRTSASLQDHSSKLGVLETRMRPVTSAATD